MQDKPSLWPWLQNLLRNSWILEDKPCPFPSCVCSRVGLKMFISVNQRHLFGYTPLPPKNQLPCTTCTNTDTARPPQLHTELRTPLCLVGNGFELPVILEIQSPCCCLWCTKQEKHSFVSAQGAGNQKTERSWCSFWFTTSWPGNSAMKSKIKKKKKGKIFTVYK